MANIRRILASLFRKATPPAPPVSEVTIDAVKRRLEANHDFHLIDVREQHEFDAGYIPTARHIPKSVIEIEIIGAVPDTSQEVILYCGAGYRSAVAAYLLMQMGYTNAHSMSGGWNAWAEAGYPAGKP